MKKFLSMFLICTFCIAVLSGVFFANKNALAEGEIIITPAKIAVKSGTSPYNAPHDISFMENNVLVLNQDSGNINSQILIFDPSESYESSDPDVVNDLNAYYNCLTSHNGEYYYTSSNQVFNYTNGYLRDFNNITDIVTSSRNLFLIDSTGASSSKIYKYNENNFEEFLSYPSENIQNFAYSEVAKKSFTYNGTSVKISGDNFSKTINIANAVEIICDFEGNLYVFQNYYIDAETQNLIVYKYTYESDYNNFVQYNLNFTDIEEPSRLKNKIIAVEFIPKTGSFALLCRYLYSGETINNVYIVSKDDVDSVTSTDIPKVSEFADINIFNKSKKIDFKIAEITGYPSTILYPAKNSDDALLPASLSKIQYSDIGKKVLVFKTFSKFAYIAFDDKIAVVYSNSLKFLNEENSELDGAKVKVLLNRSRIMLYPSSFIFKNGSVSYNFETDKLAKDDLVTVLSEINMNGITYCRIKYDGNKEGYINKAELSEDFDITTLSPKRGRIDSNKVVNLYIEQDIESLVLVTLKHKQELEILDSNGDFYCVRVTIDGQTHTGFVEAKYVLESGLTNLQKMGLWIFLIAIALTAIAIVIRIIVTRKKSKQL